MRPFGVVQIFSAFPYQVNLTMTCVSDTQQLVPGLGAEMRDIDNGRRIIGHHAQHLARRKRLQPLAGFQHRQGAQQPVGIKFGIMVHVTGLGRMFQLVHQDVTSICVTLQGGWHR